MTGGTLPRSTGLNRQSVLTYELDQLRAELDALKNHSAVNQETQVPSIDGRRDGAGAKNERRRIRFGTVASILGHSGLLLFILLSASHQVVRSGRIPISIDTFGKATHTPQTAFKSTGPEGKLSLDLSQEILKAARPMSPVSEDGAVASPDQRERAVPNPSFSASEQSQQVDEIYLWNAERTSGSGGGSLIDFVEQGTKESPDLKITRHTDWEGNPVEDNKLTYSAPGSAVRLTVREASSAGFAGTNFARDLSLNQDDTSEPFGLTPTAWGADAMAKSEKVDWTLVDLKNFGVTVFGYQNEVGSNFKPFEQTKNEFASAGSSTMKAGGQVRVGPFGFGFAQSSREQLTWSGLQGFETGANLAAVQQEASVTLDLAHLPGMQASGLSEKFLPTLWASASNGHTPTSGQEAVPSDTLSTSFGGTWAWDMGQMNLGYWSYSSSQVAGSAWTGQGVDASLGLYYSSFGVDADFSYGYSADVAPSWQSAGALYGSSVTISYTPAKLPGIWAAAAAGNYDQSAITFGGISSAFSDINRTSSNGEYWSIAAGIDLTRLFWTPDVTESSLPRQLSSVKLLYRYSDSLYSDNSAGPMKDVSSLAAVMIQRTF